MKYTHARPSRDSVSGFLKKGKAYPIYDYDGNDTLPGFCIAIKDTELPNYNDDFPEMTDDHLFCLATPNRCAWLQDKGSYELLNLEEGEKDE